jgi:hypothetical protein
MGTKSSSSLSMPKPPPKKRKPAPAQKPGRKSKKSQWETVTIIWQLAGPPVVGQGKQYENSALLENGTLAFTAYDSWGFMLCAR